MFVFTFSTNNIYGTIFVCLIFLEILSKNLLGTQIWHLFGHNFGPTWPIWPIFTLWSTISITFQRKKNLFGNRSRFGRVMIKSSKMTILSISRARLVRSGPKSLPNTQFLIPFREKKNYRIWIWFTQVKPRTDGLLRPGICTKLLRARLTRVKRLRWLMYFVYWFSSQLRALKF